MIELNPLNLILLLASAQGVFLSALILHKYDRLYANRFLGIYIFSYSVILLNLVLEDFSLFERYPALLFFHLGLPFIIGPLHYLYAKYLTHPSLNFKKKEWLHFLIVIVVEIYFLYSYFYTNTDLITNDAPLNQYPPVYILFNWVITIQGMIYMLSTLLLLKRYAARLKNVFSTTEKIQLDWLRNITYVFLLVLAMFLIENIMLLQGVRFSHYFDLSSLFVALSVYVVGYMGFFKSDVFSQPGFTTSIYQLTDLSSPEKEVDNLENSGQRYRKSGLSEESAGKYQEALIHLMDREKRYRESELSLKQLADELSISPHNLSEVINTRLRLNFFDFINGYRVEEVKRDLADPHKQHYTILAIAFDAGFNSKTSFNTIFKKQTGKTPTEYRKKVMQSDL